MPQDTETWKPEAWEAWKPGKPGEAWGQTGCSPDPDPKAKTAMARKQSFLAFRS
jgi:hypothetical protein